MLCFTYRQIAKEVQNWIDCLPQEGEGGEGTSYKGLYVVAAPKKDTFPRLQACFTC